MRRIALCLGGLLLAPTLGCRPATMAGAAPEPVLTNPVRMDAWVGDAVVDEGTRGRGDLKYDGVFRLPLSGDWTFELPDEGRWALSRLELGTPAAYGDFVLAGSSRHAGLFVIDRLDGRLVRTLETTGPVQAPPVPLLLETETEVQVPLAGTNHMVTRTQVTVEHQGWLIADTFGSVWRLDPDLEPVWDAPYSAGSGIYRAPVVDGDQILLGTTKDQIQAIGLDDGAWRWSYKRDVARTSMELAILGAPAPIVDGEEVIAGFSDGVLAGVDRTSGRVRWEVRVGDGQFPDIEAEAIVDDGVLVAAAFGGPVLGLDRTTRRVLWTVEDAGAVSSMELADGMLYTSDSKGRVHSIEVSTGAVQWTWELPNKILGPPRRAGGSILVGEVDGTLYALDRFDGKRKWRFIPPDGTRLAGVATAPAVVGRQVLFPSASGTLWSLIAESGTVSNRSEEPAHRTDRVVGW